MELHQIRYFLAICDHRSFTRAAEFSYVSQPSLTHAIKKMEMEFDGELFTRDRSGCLLTPLGHLVESNFRKILQDTVTTKADAIRFTRLNTHPITGWHDDNRRRATLEPLFRALPTRLSEY